MGLKYRYGLLIVTNTKPDFEKLKLTDGVYFCVEFPAQAKDDEHAAQIYFDGFIKNAHRAIRKKLWPK